MNVENKTAIITGAGSGINFSYAKLLLSRGCNVVIADLTLRPEAQALITEYPFESKGAKAVFQKTDVADWTQLEKMFEVATKRFGGADIVCPGAGVYEHVRTPHDRMGSADRSSALVEFLESSENRILQRYT